MSQPNRKYTRFEALLSEFKSVDPNPINQPLNSEVDALKAQIASLDAELQENRKKLQSKTIESETIRTNLEAKAVEPNPLTQSLNREVNGLKAQVASLDAELQENRNKLQRMTIESETNLTNLEAKAVEPNPLTQSLNREVDQLKAQVAAQGAELQENRIKLRRMTIESETNPANLEAKAVEPNPLTQSLNREVDALKAKVASQGAELQENRKKLQNKPSEFETIPTNYEAKPVLLAGFNEKQLNENNQRNAIRVLLAFIAVQLLVVGLLAFQTAQTPTWQFWLMDGLGLGLMAFEIIGLVYVRRGRHELGIWLSFIPFMIVLLVIPVLYSGLGLLFLVGILTITPFVGSQILPQRQATLFNRIGISVGIAVLLMDFFIPFQRTTLPGFQNIIYFALGILLLTLGYAIVRQFRDYSLRTKLLFGFLGVLVLASLGGLFAIIQQYGAAETTAVSEASNLAETISNIVYSNQVDLQSLVVQLHETQERDVKVVGPDLRVLADAAPENIGTILDQDQNGEVAATLKDGQPRTFVEISTDFPLGIQQIVVPVGDKATGEIIGAVVMDYAQTLQQASFAEAASIAEEINATIANDPANLQTFISFLFTARQRNLTVVDPQRIVLADSNPDKIGTIITLHQNGEVAETLKDGQPRSFIEISPDFPEGQQQTITSVEDSAGNIIGVAILGPSAISEQNAVKEATQIAETISAEVSNYLTRLQELVVELNKSQGRNLKVVGLDLRILADAAPENVGTIIDNPTGEIAATLKDGQQRTLVEINPEFPQGIRLVAVPVKDESGKISGAVIMEYTPRLEELQQAQTAVVRTLILVTLAGLVLALVSGQFISSSIANPISQLKDAALKIGKGQLNTAIPALTSKDEIGILANALNSMSLQLRGLFGTLEKRIQDRTHDIELAAEVGRTVNEKVSNLNEMLSEAAEMIRSRFDLYYTQVYLLDSGGDTLTLRAGTGDVGRQLLQRGHHLLINSGSLNGRAVSDKKSIIVADTAKNPTFLPNPFLPNTRSEMAVPLIVSGRVLGVLDMQSEVPDALNESNLAAFEALAGQMAIAIQNATLFRQSEEARKQVEATVRGITATGWQDFLNAIERGEKIGYTYNQTDVVLMENLYGLNSTNALNIPITVTGANVGSIQLVDEARNWTTQETEIVQAAAGQLAQHIDNLRLLAQAESYRAEAEQAARRLTREGWETFLETRSDLTTGYTYNLNHVLSLEGRKNNEHFETALTKQFVVRNESVGELTVNIGDNSPEDINDLISAVAEQLGGHIENLRLSEQNELRAIELEKLVTQLRELDRLKSAFLANMSHELRTPLNSILGFADVMLEELDGPLTENMNNDLKLIHKNGQHLLQLINDVLDMAKIESGKMNLNIESFNVQETIEEVVSITSFLANQKNLSLIIEPDSDFEIKINADKIRVRQVMINLVNNAMKFTDQGKVSICVKREHLNVHITVKDTGIGIPVDQLESVFQEFTQVDTTTTRKAGGTGLGLPISRRLIEMHSGRLWVESTGIDGEGSTFHALLPIEAVIKEQ